jgi:cell division transport system ATP-binding protein
VVYSHGYRPAFTGVPLTLRALAVRGESPLSQTDERPQSPGTTSQRLEAERSASRSNGASPSPWVASVIEVQHLSKTYGPGAQALRDLSLFVDRGEFVFLTGPSGAGKSTLLRLLLCQEKPTEGRLTVDGEDLALMGASETQAYRRHVGFVFQDFKLIERMTVFENTAFVPRVMGATPGEQRRKAEQVLKWVGLEERLDARPSELSGGEQQRVAIARALINDPMMVLADEPTGNLDPDLALEIMNLFREISAGGTTVLVATHDRDLVRQVGRRAIMIEHGVITEETPAISDVAPFGSAFVYDDPPRQTVVPDVDGAVDVVAEVADDVVSMASSTASGTNGLETLGAHAVEGASVFPASALPVDGGQVDGEKMSRPIRLWTGRWRPTRRRTRFRRSTRRCLMTATARTTTTTTTAAA